MGHRVWCEFKKGESDGARGERGVMKSNWGGEKGGRFQELVVRRSEGRIPRGRES